MIRISLIIPFFNSALYLERCIEGLRQQTYPRDCYEILMVDNNSTDDSAAIVRRSPGVRLLSEKKQGSYAARNRGLREATGEILAFTDADCVPAPDWLRQIVSAMEQPGVRIVLGRRELPASSALLGLLAAYDNEKIQYICNSRTKELYYGYTNNMAVDKTLFDKLGPFTERLRGADTIFVQQTVHRYSCEAVRYGPQIEVQHLEIDTLAAMYQKYYIYGRSRAGDGNITPVKPLTNHERWRVFQSVVRGRDYSGIQSLILFGLLGIGLGAWGLGKISRLWREPEKAN